MSYVIFTQDLPGERKWLNQKFPGCQNLETFSSGKWPSAQPLVDHDTNVICEISHETKLDVSTWPGQKFKSLYNLDYSRWDDRWTDADDIILDPDVFTTSSKSSRGMMFHLPRSGTVFLETILETHCGYDLIVDRGKMTTKKRVFCTKDTHWTHHVPHKPGLLFDEGQNFGQMDHDLIKAQSPDIFFVYRKDWWAWVTSHIIMDHFGPFHYYNMPDFSSFPLIDITTTYIDQYLNKLKYAFNNLCEMRVKFRNLNFFIFEFGDLIKNQSLTTHSAINYNKQLLFSNYSAMEDFFKQNYLTAFDLCAERGLSHLVKMGCQTPKNFDHLIDFFYGDEPF